MTKQYKDRMWLKKMYIEENLSHKDIAENCGVSGVTIGNWCAKFDLKKSNPYANASNRLDLARPELLEEWHPDNEIRPSEVTTGSGKSVWWRCSEDHEWKTAVVNRVNLKSGCPYCSGNYVSKANRLDIHYPHLVGEWSKSNELNPSEVSHGTHTKVWWVCASCSHEWRASITSRAGGGCGCPACSGRAVTDDNRLTLVRPDLISEWSPKNDTTPNHVCYGSNQKVIWTCEHNHEWEATVSNRAIKQQGCPYCCGKRVSDTNRLSLTHPILSEEWSPENDNRAFDVSYGSGKRTKWVCSECRHEWEATISNRATKGRGCPECAKTYDGWEVAYAGYLDKKGVPYTHHPDPLTTPLGQYFPDFFLPIENKYVEIKGEYWEREKQMTKIEWLRDGGIHIEMLYGDKLKELSII